MNYEPEVIRARFVEAAFTERFLPSARGPSSKSYWPEFFHDEEDKAGWDDAARLDNAEKWKGRATSGAVSRHQECMDWTAAFISDEKRRHILWAWAFCKANDRDFGAHCRKRGWARPTAYRRFTVTIEAIATKLAMEGLVVRLPDEKWVRHETPSMASISAMVAASNDSPTIKFTPAFRTEDSRDLLTTPEGVADFTKHLDAVNAERRRLQEREAKRRAKIGVTAS